jgi:uncharacterized protein YggE
MKKKLFVALLAAGALMLGACQNGGAAATAASPAEEAAQRQTVTVNSTESVTVVPDIAEIVYSIETQEADAQTCQQKNSEETDKVVAMLKELGVEESSIQTTGYYLNPRYDWSTNTQVLIGYEAVTTLTVSDLPLDQTGSILSASVEAGVNNIQSISYLSSQYDASYQEALSLAVTAAQEKAQAMAAAGGFELEGIATMQETSNYTEARYNDTAAAQMYSSTEASDEKSATIMPGELEVEASVVVEFIMRPTS